MIRRLFYILMGIVITTPVLLWMKGKDMREISTEIEIQAPPQKVWEVLTNVKDWDQWSPIIQKSEGDAALGSKLDITMVSKEGKGGKDGPFYQPEVTIFEPGKSFRWRAHMGASFIMTNDKSFTLEPTETGTRLVHKEHFQGLMVPLFWKSVQQNVPGMLDSMNQALKKLVEGDRASN